jgi:hypothetical protein
MLHQGGQTKGIILLVMHRYVRIISLLILCTPLWLSVGGMYESLYFLIFEFCGEYFGCACMFRMRPHVFLRLVQAVDNVDPYFHFKYDAARRADLSPLQKCVAAIHILGYGVLTDTVDEYVRIGESIARA